MEAPVGRERSSKHGNTSDMQAPSSPQLETRWLEAWRTTSDCTRGALGLLCALEPLMTNLHRAREVSVAHLYGGGGKRASRMLREKSSHSHSSGQPEYGPNSSNMQSVDFERGATPLSHGTGGVKLTPSHTPNDHSEDGRGSTPVPPINGFSMFVRRWESQAAVAVAEGGGSRRRRRQSRVDSDDEALDDDDNEGLPVASETARPADSNRRLRSGFRAPRVKQLGGLASGKAKQEEEEDEEEEPEEDEEDEEYELGSEANFGEDGHLACVPGDVLHNRYALVRQLGCGCRSRVWLAVDLNQCSVTRRQLVRELDEQQVRRYFTALDRPLFVAIKVFRCGVIYTQAAEHETLMLMYIKECKKVRQLQRLVSTPSSRALSREVSAVSPPREPAQDGALTTLSDGSRSPTSHCQSNSEETMWLPSAERVISIRECFKHHGPFGLHHCVVMDVMGASVSALMKEAGPHGVPENVARGIVHSTLEGLALLASIHVTHTDIKPDNLLCVELEEDVANDVEAFLMYHFDMPVPTGLDGRAVRRSVAAEDSSMNQSQESYFVSAQTSLKDVVDTPRTARSRSSCGTARRLFRAQHHWGSRAEAPYSVQLADFGLSFIVPPDLRHFHCTKTYDGAECSGAQEGVAEDTVSNPSKLLNDDSFLAASTLLSNAVASVGVMSSAANPFQDVTLSSKPLTSSGCATSGVSELEQEILSRQNFGRGLALQSRKYRSPEIILGRECYAAIDIWSIGCIAFELVCGRLLFDPVRDFSEAEERNERAEEQQKQRDQNFTTSPEFNECEGKDAGAAHDSDETKHAIAALGPNHFVEREKNVDVCHLRAMILLLGAPNPRYITSSPTGECVKDFFDDNGEFLFLTDDERAQLYDYEGKQCRTCSFSAPTRVVECERGASEDETNLPRHSTASVATCARCRVTPLWLKVRHEIEERLGAEDGAVFEGFLLKCLQWDPSRRSTAHALRKDAWVTGAEDVVTTVEG